jgi:hypothetical protein
MSTSLWRSVPFVCFAALLGFSSSAHAQYSCVVNISPTASTTCANPVVIQPFSFGSIERLADVDLNQGGAWQSLTVRVRVCDPTGWFVHIGDSPTNNGFSGDGGSTQHDAEAHAVGNTLQVYRSDIGSGSILSCQFPSLGSGGCVTQDWTVINDRLTFDPDTASTAPLSICDNTALFEFPAYDEADAEDAAGNDADKLHIGLNRTYGPRVGGTGTGLQKACFYLSTSTVPSQTDITTACGF